jgi:hypothetical protein
MVQGMLIGGALKRLHAQALVGGHHLSMRGKMGEQRMGGGSC